MIAGRIAGTLPLDITPFVGREDLLERTSGLLGHASLLTLIGPGGVGKTRLALRALKQERSGNGWMIDVKTLAGGLDGTPESLYAAIALELGIRHNGVAGLGTILDHLRGTRTVLVLDNCEDLVPQMRAFVKELLVAAPHVRILATSRQPLGVEGEHTLLVPPLTQANAVRLFIENARTTGADIKAIEGDPDVARLCAYLDGLPLAIGLAAAHTAILSVKELWELLQDSFDVLTDIELIMAWSYDNCSPDEKSVWTIASLFTAPFDLAAIGDIGAGTGMDGTRAMKAVTGLVQKSVLIADRSEPTTRFNMLNIMRSYGRRIADDDNITSLRDLHGMHIRELVGSAATEWFGPSEIDVMAAIHRQLPDILAAVDHCLARGDLRTARAICIDLVRSRSSFFFGSLGLVSQLLRRVIDASLATTPPKEERADIATTMAMASWIAVTVGRNDDAESFATRADALLAEGDMAPTPLVLFARGARKVLGQGLTIGIGILDTARSFLGRVATGDRHMVTMVLAMGLALAGEPAEAVKASSEFLSEAEQIGLPTGIPWALWTAALAAFRNNDLTSASTFIAECQRRQFDVDDHWGPTWSIELGAWIIAAQATSDPNPAAAAKRAAWLLGAAQARQDKIGVLMTGLRPFAERRGTALAQIAVLIDDTDRAKAFADGKRHHQHAVAVALGARIPRGQRQQTPDNLTAREREIVELVVKGLTSTKIGARLHITSGTVDVHIKRILGKLGVPNRTALATWAASQTAASAD
jgi:predicted ATPase/DNA-binding CsgD family transcriptional regulator